MATTKPPVLERLLNPQRGALSPELARFILEIDFSSDDRARIEQLSKQAQAGSLSTDDRAELDEFLTANDFLTILKSKARASLNQRPSTAA